MTGSGRTLPIFFAERRGEPRPALLTPTYELLNS